MPVRKKSVTLRKYGWRKVMQILWKGQGGGGRKSLRPVWKGGAYKPEPGASDSEGVEKASAADSAALAEEAAEEAAWGTDMSSLVFVFGTWHQKNTLAIQ